jgi:hypothetical protein
VGVAPGTTSPRDVNEVFWRETTRKRFCCRDRDLRSRKYFDARHTIAIRQFFHGAAARVEIFFRAIMSARLAFFPHFARASIDRDRGSAKTL